MKIVSRLSIATLLAAISCGGSQATGVNTTRTAHPRGVLSGRSASIGGRPFGIAISRTGMAYVTQQDSNAVTPLPAPYSARATSIPIGADAGDVIFNSAGTLAFASAFYGGTVHEIDVASGTQKGAVTIGTNAYRLALSSDESTLFVTSTVGHVYVVNVPTLRVTGSIALNGNLQGIARSPDAQWLYVSSTAGSIWKLNAATGAIQASASDSGKPQEVAVSHDGATLYVANQGGTVDLLDAATLTRRTRIAAPDAFGLALTPDGMQLYVTAPDQGLVQIVDLKSNAVLASLPVGFTPRRVAFDAAGTTALVANEGGWADIIK